jgi:DNA invertase Pin-like site-specific DNA recombinase
LQLSERTKAGMAAAKRRGQHVGRPRKLSPTQIQTAHELTAQKKQSIKSMAEMFEVDPETLRRALKKYRAA